MYGVNSYAESIVANILHAHCFSQSYPLRRHVFAFFRHLKRLKHCLMAPSRWVCLVV